MGNWGNIKPESSKCSKCVCCAPSLLFSSTNVVVVVAVAGDCDGDRAGNKDDATIGDGQRRRQIADLPGSKHNCSIKKFN